MPKSEIEQRKIEQRKDNAKFLHDAMQRSPVGSKLFQDNFKQEAGRLQKLVIATAALQAAIANNTQLAQAERAKAQQFIDITNKQIDAMENLLNATLEGVKKYPNPLKAGAMESVYAVNAMLNGISAEIAQNPTQAKQYFNKSHQLAKEAQDQDLQAVWSRKEEHSGFSDAADSMADVAKISIAAIALCAIMIALFPPTAVLAIFGCIGTALSMLSVLPTNVGSCADTADTANTANTANLVAPVNDFNDAASLEVVKLTEQTNTQKGPSAVSPSINTAPKSVLKDNMKNLQQEVQLQDPILPPNGMRPR